MFEGLLLVLVVFALDTYRRDNRRIPLGGG